MTHNPLSRRLALAASLVLGLSGCANKFETMTPQLQASMLSDLQAGKMNLDCGIKCDFTWLQNASSVHALDLAENWRDLAIRVMQIGYGSDLAYYYLGQSAQGLGYHHAAIAYYATSLAINGGGNPLLKCSAATNSMSDACQGVDLAGSIPVLMQASRDAIAQQQLADQQADTPAPAPPTHHRHHVVASAAATSATPPAPSSTGSDWVEPPPPSAPAQ